MTDTVTARLITDDSDALRTAHALVPRLAAEADQRDAERRLPWPELAEIRASGLLGITVPASRGGAEVAAATVAEVMRLVGTVDLSVAQILQPHFAFLYSLRRNGSPTLQEKVFTDVLNGALVGNAQAEGTGKHSHDQRTTLERTGADRYRITGVKYYATGSLFAQWLAVTALLPVPGMRTPSRTRSSCPLTPPGWRWSTIGTAWGSAPPAAALSASPGWTSPPRGWSRTTARLPTPSPMDRSPSWGMPRSTSAWLAAH